MNDQLERRDLQPLELRQHDDGPPRLEGYAVLYESPSKDLGGFIEVFERGAFKRSLDDGDDVLLLVEHEDLPLARLSAGTLEVRDDDVGLWVGTNLDPDDPDVQRVIPKIRRGDLKGMSPAFKVRPNGEEWRRTGGKPSRHIRDAKLCELSITATPAYEEPEVALRSLKQFETGRQERVSKRLRLRAETLRRKYAWCSPS